MSVGLIVESDDILIGGDSCRFDCAAIRALRLDATDVDGAEVLDTMSSLSPASVCCATIFLVAFLVGRLVGGLRGITNVGVTVDVIELGEVAPPAAVVLAQIDGPACSVS